MDPHCSSANNARPFPDSGLAHFSSITIETRAVPVLDIRHFSISTVCRNDVHTNLARFAHAARDHRGRFNFSNFVIVRANFRAWNALLTRRVARLKGIWIDAHKYSHIRIFACIQGMTCIFAEMDNDGQMTYAFLWWIYRE